MYHVTFSFIISVIDTYPDDFVITALVIAGSPFAVAESK